MNQTELQMNQNQHLTAPYNGMFYCHIRSGLFRWPEYISFYKQKRL